jgi:hypothetical protein
LPAVAGVVPFPWSRRAEGRCSHRACLPHPLPPLPRARERGRSPAAHRQERARGEGPSPAFPLSAVTPSPLRSVDAPGMEWYDIDASGCSSAWLERTVRDREAGGSNPLTPTISLAGRLPTPTGILGSRPSSCHPAPVPLGHTVRARAAVAEAHRIQYALAPWCSGASAAARSAYRGSPVTPRST